jgi:hypothetical protein
MPDFHPAHPNATDVFGGPGGWTWRPGSSASARSESNGTPHPYEGLAFEQVPAVLPVWERMAEAFRREGYAVATGKLSAEHYDVP